jgi:hypothetical protein
MLFAKTELFQQIGTLNGLQCALQTAVELEHATIPPYLTALYSLRGSSSAEIRRRIRSVMTEEMLHMTIACNLLNAIGGKPNLTKAGFLPNYPTALPGTVEDKLKVPIRSFSLELVRDVFMAIEEPEDPKVFPVKPTALALQAPGPLTIGQFYASIKEQLDALGDEIFCGDPHLQVPFPSGIFDGKIADRAQAKAAIDVIVGQGEGTDASPLNPTTPGALRDNFAHFYKFGEIFHQRKLVADANPTGFAYAGSAIPFDRTKDVYPMMDTPKRQTYVDMGEQTAVDKCDAFNRGYTDLLKGLHTVFNGHAGDLGDLVGGMNNLAALANDLIKILLKNGLNAGPTFELKN